MKISIQEKIGEFIEEIAMISDAHGDHFISADNLCDEIDEYKKTCKCEPDYAGSLRGDIVWDYGRRSIFSTACTIDENIREELKLLCDFSTLLAEIAKKETVNVDDLTYLPKEIPYL